jgi:glycosyltransferase involved in cell wall biosynthesis
VTRALTRLSVVLPARNEAGRLGDCLNAIGAAITVYAATPGSLPVDVVIALDSCTDDSAAVIARHPGTRNVQVREGSVGRARNAAVLTARTVLGHGAPPGGVHWIAMTDADTRVPPHWLAAQVRLAEEGADVVVGTVEPDPAELDHLTHGTWQSHQDLRELDSPTASTTGGSTDQGKSIQRSVLRQT